MYAINIKWETRSIVPQDVLHVVVPDVLLIGSVSHQVLDAVVPGVLLAVVQCVLLAVVQCVVDVAQATLSRFKWTTNGFNLLKEIKITFPKGVEI